MSYSNRQTPDVLLKEVNGPDHTILVCLMAADFYLGTCYVEVWYSSEFFITLLTPKDDSLTLVLNVVISYFLSFSVSVIDI